MLLADFYIYTTCDYGDGYYDQTGWAYYAYASSSTGFVEVDFSSATLDYSGVNTMDTYQGTTLLIKSRMIVDYGYSRTTSISYQQTVLGCTDPNATNHDPAANTDDGSCICGGTTLTMTDSEDEVRAATVSGNTLTAEVIDAFISDVDCVVMVFTK